jgi:hypothetical protein
MDERKEFENAIDHLLFVVSRVRAKTQRPADQQGPSRPIPAMTTASRQRAGGVV